MKMVWWWHNLIFSSLCVPFSRNFNGNEGQKLATLSQETNWKQFPVVYTQSQKWDKNVQNAAVKPPACGLWFTWVLNILMSFLRSSLRVQTMENCFWFVKDNLHEAFTQKSLILGLSYLFRKVNGLGVVHCRYHSKLQDKIVP